MGYDSIILKSNPYRELITMQWKMTNLSRSTFFSSRVVRILSIVDFWDTIQIKRMSNIIKSYLSEIVNVIDAIEDYKDAGHGHAIG